MYYGSALAPSTRTQYDAHVVRFLTFCVAAGLDHAQPSEPTVMLYAALLARSVKPQTVRQYLKGLRSHYRQRQQPEFGDPVAWPHLYAMLRGVARMKQADVAKKCPITPAMLFEFRRGMGTCARSKALWACMLVTFFAYFRKSNTTTEAGSAYAPGHTVRVGDVSFVPAQYALKVVVRSSKTRQFGTSTAVWVKGLKGHVLDPVHAWAEHAAANRVAEDPLVHAFAHRGPGGGFQPMRHADIVAAAKSMAVAAGMQAQDAAGHSFRRGGASFAFECGVPDILIQRQGDWASSCYREYVNVSPIRALEATDRMLRALTGTPCAATWGSGLVPAANPFGHSSVAASAGFLADE